MPDLSLMLPEFILFGWAIVVLIAGLVRGDKKDDFLLYLSLVGIILSGATIPLVGYGVLFGGTFFVDKFSVLFKLIFLGAAFFGISSSSGLIRKLDRDHAEYFGMIMMSTVGMMFLVSTGELITLYVSLELTTIPLFVLAAFQKSKLKSTESGLKYLILGAVSSAILLYGISLIYGLTGTTFMTVAITRLLQQSIGMLTASGQINLALIVAMIMMIGGFGFKLALVPFHMWAPDVYEGAPTPITSFLSVASKGAGLAAFARVFFAILPSFREDWWGIIVAVLAAAAMIIGNITAVMQSNVKRMLAYSSIAHAGFVLVGFLGIPAAGHQTIAGPGSIMFYMVAYLFANMGAFAIAIAFERNFGTYEIKDYAGLSKESPFMAAVMLIFLLSLAGIPPTAGFFAKYYVFLAGWNNYPWLVMIGVLTSVIALFYYANIIKQMYFNREESAFGKPTLDFPMKLTLALTVLGTIYFGIFPQSVIDFARQAMTVFPF